MVSCELSWISSQLIYTGWLVSHSFSKVHAFGNAAQVAGYIKKIQQSIAPSQLVQCSTEMRRQSHQLSDGLAAAGSQPAPVPAEQQVLLRYAEESADDMSYPLCSS